MPISGNVSLTNTFDDWRSYTNQTIAAHNELEQSKLNFTTDTPSTVQINGQQNFSSLLIGSSNTVTLSVSALPLTGGSVGGKVNIANPNCSVSVNSSGIFLKNTDPGIASSIQFLSNGHIIMI